MTNVFAVTITNKLFVTAAYKCVALAVMLTNCNQFVQETHLPLGQRITQTNIILSRCSVNPPRLMEFGGSVVTEKYFLGFGHGHLANFWQWEFRSAATAEGITEQHEQWVQMVSQIGTNEVRQLADNWLANLGVDVATMDGEYPCKITQRFFYKNSGSGLKPLDKVELPIFEISWGAIPIQGHPQYSFPAATMTVFGPTKELIEYHLLDDSLMLRPKLEVKDFESLLAIPDTAFDQFSDPQRGNLVRRFEP
jgi:hypothetical protein